MAIFKTKQTTQATNKPVHFGRIYQYADGTYLPDTSQPNLNENYEITTGAYTPHTSTRYMNVLIGSNGKAQREGKDGKSINCEKILPELYAKREDCCGCTACYAICPVRAIAMRPDEESFLYPIIDAGKCIRCYKCISVCPTQRKG